MFLCGHFFNSHIYFSLCLCLCVFRNYRLIIINIARDIALVSGGSHSPLRIQISCVCNGCLCSSRGREHTPHRQKRAHNYHSAMASSSCTNICTGAKQDATLLKVHSLRMCVPCVLCTVHVSKGSCFAKNFTSIDSVAELYICMTEASSAYEKRRKKNYAVCYGIKMKKKILEATHSQRVWKSHRTN